MDDRSSSEISIFGFGWKGIVPALERLDVEDKLAESRYFLARMHGSTTPEEFRWNSSAFLASARSTLDWMAWIANRRAGTDPGGADPRERGLATLGKYMKVYERPGTSGKQKLFVSPRHPLLVALYEKRQETSRRSSRWIEADPEGMPGGAGSGNEAYAFMEPADSSLEARPGTKVLPFCRDALALVEQIRRELEID